jgi:methylated-DNA-protein-cysteine methyltransferase-like protein
VPLRRRARGPIALCFDSAMRAPPGSREFAERVGAVLGGLGSGEVTSYGEVAEQAGFPGAARAVGALLAASDGSFPWWRVVTASGRLVPGLEEEHAKRLRAEGVELRSGRVALKRGAPRRGAALPTPKTC